MIMDQHCNHHLLIFGVAEEIVEKELVGGVYFVLGKLSNNLRASTKKLDGEEMRASLGPGGCPGGVQRACRGGEAAGVVG